MTQAHTEVSYRSCIQLLRKKWDISYHSKDLYFSHANKILEPYYDTTTKQFYGAETNPTRLAIVKFIDQFRDEPGLYELDKFPDLLKHCKNFRKRTRVQKPYRAGRHQQSHSSLCDSERGERYQFQEIQPEVQELLPRTHPLKYTLHVTNHPYEKLIGRTWTHIYVPAPIDYEAVDELERTRYVQLLTEACLGSDDMIVVEPIRTRFFAQVWLRVFWWCKLTVKALYALSIIHCCHHPQKWERNFFYFGMTSIAHFGLVANMGMNPLAKYKLADRFHDTESLNELKYFKEHVPLIMHKVLVLFKDVEGQIREPSEIMTRLHFINLFVLGYNYMFGIGHWFTFHKS